MIKSISYQKYDKWSVVAQHCHLLASMWSQMCTISYPNQLYVHLLERATTGNVLCGNCGAVHRVWYCLACKCACPAWAITSSLIAYIRQAKHQPTECLLLAAASTQVYCLSKLTVTCMVSCHCSTITISTLFCCLSESFYWV